MNRLTIPLAIVAVTSGFGAVLVSAVDAPDTRSLVLLAANLAGIGAVLWVWACRLRKARS